MGRPGTGLRRRVLIRWLYSQVLRLLTPVYLARLWWRGRKEPVYRKRLGERLGYYALPPRRGKGGVVWHTQGSGKSLTMLMLAGTLVRAAEMANPTVVIVTDRNDLDDQLFDTFAMGRALLRQDPVQADSREHLRQLLDRASGGVVFTTIHKFTEAHGMISERANRPFGIRSPRPRVKRRHAVRRPRIGCSAAWAVAVIARVASTALYAAIVRR